MSKEVKRFILEEISSDALLPVDERMKYEQKAFKEQYPEFDFEITGENYPYSIRILNNMTGEVRWATCKGRIDPVTLSYTFNGKKLDSFSFYDEILKEMYL